MAKQESPETVMKCSECLAGYRRLRYLTYLTWFQDQLITVPNFPAWVCDICGRRDYDVRAISWLNTILHSQGGSSHHRRSVYT